MTPLPSPEVRPSGTEPACHGLHLIGNLASENIALLNNYRPFKEFIDQEIRSLGLTKIGEVYHNFDRGGFTAVVCLSESHLSIHTWPERNYATFDVFLSNFRRDNSPATRQIYDRVIHFLGATVLEEQAFQR